MKIVVAVATLVMTVAVIGVGVWLFTDSATGQPERPELAGVPLDSLGPDFTLPEEAQDAIPEDKAIEIAEGKFGGQMKAKQAILTQMDATDDLGPGTGKWAAFKGLVWAVSLDTTGVPGSAAGVPATVDYWVVLLEAKTGEVIFAQLSNTPIEDVWSKN